MPTLKLITAPAAEPVTLTEARLHLRQDATTADDDLITALIVAARQRVELEINRSLISTTWEWWVDAFPEYYRPYVYRPGKARHREEIYLPNPPLASVTSLTYVDLNGDTQTLSTSDYQVCGIATQGAGYVVPAYGKSWPIAQCQPESVKIRYVAGYGATAASVRESTKAAIKLLIGHFYENREATVSERASFILPLGVSALLAPEYWGKYS